MKHYDLIKQMTLEEKASLMSGENFWNTKAIERLAIPSIMMTDGPHGLRKQAGKADHLGLNKSVPATCFPTAATIANSWDRGLVKEMGELLGKEAVKENVSILLGPGLNIKRNPLCGRNFEYFSEDPYLTGELSSVMVEGIQSRGVSACPKHFAVNSQEHMRMTIDEIVDERSLREIYLSAFEKVVKKAKPKTIMSSYNKVNGIFANENQHLTNDILYDEWGYEGVMVTDWGGNNDRVAGLKAKNQLEMPATNGITDKEIVDAIKIGDLDEAVLDEAVDNMLDLIFSTSTVPQNEIHIDLDDHHQRAVEIAKRSMVLLKNENGILPLNKKEKVAIIGDFAMKPRYQGAGSSLINPSKLPSPLEVIQSSELNIVGYEQGFKRMGGKSDILKRKAVTLAQQASVILLFVGLDESSEAEGIDRKDLKLPQNQLDLIEALTQVGTKIILVLAGGGVLELAFADKVTAILHTYLAGQGVAEATRDILLGEYNPSGKLSETYPFFYEDTPSASYYPGKEATSEHREGLFIGYRYFNKIEKKVRYPFGYGLSYTTFDYTNLNIKGNTITFDVTNTGKVFGEEVSQIYIEKENSKIFRAKCELKGFEKVGLLPGETKTVQVVLDSRDFAYYSEKQCDWVIEPGIYYIRVGSSIEDIRLQACCKQSGRELLKEYQQEKYPHYFSGEVTKVTDEEFISILGYHPPEKYWDKKRNLGMNDTIAQARNKHWLGKITYGLVAIIRDGFKLLRKPIWSNNMYFVINMPFRQVERFTGGKISRKMVERYLKIINGR